MLQIPENIKRARVSAGKTQKEMAHELGVKRTTYANWEGTIEPDIGTLVKISQILGVKFGRLISEEIDGEIVYNESKPHADLNQQMIKLLNEKIKDLEKIYALELKIAELEKKFREEKESTPLKKVDSAK